MPREIQLQVAPEIAASDLQLKDYVAKTLRVPSKEIEHIVQLKRSIDARQKSVKINVKVNVFFKGENFVEEKID